MTTIDVRSENSVQVPGTGYGRLQSPRSYLPVSDVDRAKQFYRSLGRREDPHFPITENFRVVDMTPSGSAASIILGTGITAAEPGSAEALVLAVYMDARRHGGTERSFDQRRALHGGGGTFFPDDVERLEAFSDLMTRWIRRYAEPVDALGHRRAADSTCSMTRRGDRAGSTNWALGPAQASGSASTTRRPRDRSKSLSTLNPSASSRASCACCAGRPSTRRNRPGPVEARGRRATSPGRHRTSCAPSRRSRSARVARRSDRPRRRAGRRRWRG
jgi:catechol 2,3-dioxygenase-like lactoylglutathione lyase family enzyme